MDSVFSYYCSGKRCFDKLIKTINDNFRFLSVCKMEILWYSLKVQLIQIYRDGQESLAKFKIQLKKTTTSICRSKVQSTKYFS